MALASSTVCRFILDGSSRPRQASGKLLPMEDIPEDTWRAIKSIEVLKNGSTRVKFFDKMQALDGLPRQVLKEIE